MSKPAFDKIAEGMNEVLAIESNAPKKPRRRARRKTLPRAIKTSSEFAGITPADCCTACNVGGCVISGKPYCAHPYKGGLHAQEINNLAAFQRLNEAKKLLGKKKVIVPANI